MNIISEKFWTTFDGRRIKYSELSDQHISNIIWYNQIIHKVKSPLLELVLAERNIFKPLEYKPLPISGEVKWLKDNGFIIGQNIVYYGEIIGSISHIND
jgi:hypothetical protein